MLAIAVVVDGFSAHCASDADPEDDEDDDDDEAEECFFLRCFFSLWLRFFDDFLEDLPILEETIQSVLAIAIDSNSNFKLTLKMKSLNS